MSEEEPKSSEETEENLEAVAAPEAENEPEIQQEAETAPTEEVEAPAGDAEEPEGNTEEAADPGEAPEETPGEGEGEGAAADEEETPAQVDTGDDAPDQAEDGEPKESEPNVEQEVAEEEANPAEEPGPESAPEEQTEEGPADDQEAAPADEEQQEEAQEEADVPGGEVEEKEEAQEDGDPDEEVRRHRGFAPDDEIEQAEAGVTEAAPEDAQAPVEEVEAAQEGEAEQQGEVDAPSEEVAPEAGESEPAPRVAEDAPEETEAPPEETQPTEAPAEEPTEDAAVEDAAKEPAAELEQRTAEEEAEEEAQRPTEEDVAPEGAEGDPGIDEETPPSDLPAQEQEANAETSEPKDEGAPTDETPQEPPQSAPGQDVHEPKVEAEDIAQRSTEAGPFEGETVEQQEAETAEGETIQKPEEKETPEEEEPKAEGSLEAPQAGEEVSEAETQGVDSVTVEGAPPTGEEGAAPPDTAAEIAREDSLADVKAVEADAERRSEEPKAVEEEKEEEKGSAESQPPEVVSAQPPHVPDNTAEVAREPSDLGRTSVQSSGKETAVDQVTITTGGPSTAQAPPHPDIQPKSATPQEKKVRQLGHCLNLIWAFGVNRSCPALNMLYKLTADDPGRDAVLYTCSNVAVLYNFTENTQTLLQGHSHAISCTAVSEDKRWLVTADSGRFASIIVWDTFTSIPVQTIFDPHPSDDIQNETGTIAVAITTDAKYIASLGAAFPQTISIWDWTSTAGAKPMATALISLNYSSSLQTYIYFNPANPCQLVSNSEDQVVFHYWDGEENIQVWDPVVTDQDFNRVVGSFSQSIHAPEGKWTYTATSAGNVVVWAPDKVLSRQPNKVVTPAAAYKLKAFKLVKLQEKAITVLTTHDNYVVTGDSAGFIKFYDYQLRMINWYQEFDKIGPINALSFAYCPGFPFDKLTSNSTNLPTDATIQANKFPIKEFIIGTSTAKIGKIQNDGTELLMVQNEHDGPIHAVATHPIRDQLCIGSHVGYIKIWDYINKKTIAELRMKPKKKISCVTYDPSGKFLGVGFEDGTVRVLDALTLTDELKMPFNMSKAGITHIKFSLNSKYLVTADKDLCVAVYKAQYEPGEAPFTYLAKRRAHYKEITGILFGISLESGNPRLMSLSKDRVLVEYDLENSAEDDLKVISTNKIEQSAEPLCLDWYPPVSKEDFIITASDQFKLKLYNSTTKMCRKTVLGPTYGSPIERLAVLPFQEDPFGEQRYIAFATRDRLGVHRLPVVGNPHDAMVTVAHPQGIANLTVSHDAKFLFTAGGPDATVQMWQVHLPALEASAQLGGQDLLPFYDLIEGGKTGHLFRELEDYFYYAMIRSQGVNTMKKRHVSESIPISEIPFVMRALGFYPTEQEIEDMLNEVKFSQYVETGKYVTEINLNTFIKLYVNHRPAFGLNPALITDAFKNLSNLQEERELEGAYAIDRDEFIDLLQNRGEQLNDTELAEFISVLLGISPEGSVSEFKDFKAIESDPNLLDKLPSDITADLFATSLLGFPITPLLGQKSPNLETPIQPPTDANMVDSGTQAG